MAESVHVVGPKFYAEPGLCEDMPKTVIFRWKVRDLHQFHKDSNVDLLEDGTVIVYGEEVGRVRITGKDIKGKLSRMMLDAESVTIPLVSAALNAVSVQLAGKRFNGKRQCRWNLENIQEMLYSAHRFRKSFGLIAKR